MRFKNEQNEIFWKNIIKHNLTRYEFKVLVAFVTDAPTYRTSINDLKKRTNIKRPHISRALSGLCFQNILFKEDGIYHLNDILLIDPYEPRTTSSMAYRSSKEQAYVHGNGNFTKQSELKNEKMRIIDENIKNMHRKNKEANTVYNKWHKFYSDYNNSDVWCLCEKNGDKFRVHFSNSNPNLGGRTSIAPLEITEEFCKIILNLINPEEIMPYIYSVCMHDFCKKHNLEYPQ